LVGVTVTCHHLTNGGYDLGGRGGGRMRKRRREEGGGEIHLLPLPSSSPAITPPFPTVINTSPSLHPTTPTTTTTTTTHNYHFPLSSALLPLLILLPLLLPPPPPPTHIEGVHLISLLYYW